MTATLSAQHNQFAISAGAVPRPAVESARLAPEVYRARRLAVLALVSGLLGGVLIGLISSGGAAVASTGEIVAIEDSVIVTVAAGDTLWGIARSLSPETDPRPLVHELAIIAGDDPIQPGQSLVIPRSILD